MMLKKTPVQFLLVIQTQLFAVTCILLAYGISQNVFQEEKHEIEFANCFFNAALTPFEEQPDGTWHAVAPRTPEETNALLADFLPTFEDDELSHYFLEGSVTVNGEAYSIGGALEPEPGALEKSPFSAKEYEEGAHLVQVCSHQFPCAVGDQIQIGSEQYIVKETDNAEAICLRHYTFDMPLLAFPDDARISAVGFVLSDMPTEARAKEIAASIEEHFGAGTHVELPTIRDLMQIQFQRLALMICVIIAILVLLNVSLVYFYLLGKRNRLLGIYSLCGCTKNQLSTMLSCEWLLLLTACYGGAFLLFRTVVIKRMTFLMDMPALFYTPRVYLGIYVGYILFSLALLLFGDMKRIGQTTVSMMREV